MTGSHSIGFSPFKIFGWALLVVGTFGAGYLGVAPVTSLPIGGVWVLAELLASWRRRHKHTGAPGVGLGLRIVIQLLVVAALFGTGFALRATGSDARAAGSIGFVGWLIVGFLAVVALPLRVWGARALRLAAEAALDEIG